MSIDTILFDMDGVLIDSEYALRSCCIETLSNYGIKAAHEDFMQFIGMGEDKFIGGVVRKHGKEYTQEMKTKCYENYGRRAKNFIAEPENIKEMLNLLKKDGYKMAVASSADKMKVDINLSCIDVEASYFDTVTNGSEITHKKPHPEIFITCAKKLKKAPENCIVIEDAISGVQAAKAANMLCIAVLTSFSEKELKDAGADYIVKETPEIVDIIRTLK